MWQRHDLLQDELYGKGPEKKGGRPYVPAFMRLLGLARDERDTSDTYAPIPDALLGVGATRQGLLLAQVLFGLVALAALTLILPLRQIGCRVAVAISAAIGDAPSTAERAGIMVQWGVTLLGLAVWGGTMPELYRRFTEAPTYRVLLVRFAVMLACASIVWVLGALAG